MKLRSDNEHSELIAEGLLCAAAASEQAAYAARTDSDTISPEGVVRCLDEAAKHLIYAAWATCRGAGHHDLTTRGLRCLWAAATLRRLRHAGRIPAEAGDRAQLALIHVGQLKSRTGTLGFHPALTTGLVEAWLLLGQVDYAMATGTALGTTKMCIPETADDEAEQVRAITDQLERVVVTMVASGDSPALAAAAGPAALARSELTSIAVAASNRRGHDRLDLAAEPLDLLPPVNAGSLKSHAAEIAACLRALATESKNAAEFIDADVAWRRAMSTRIRRCALHLTTASNRTTAWANNV